MTVLSAVSLPGAGEQPVWPRKEKKTAINTNRLAVRNVSLQ
jgi:hypothetical protein